MVSELLLKNVNYKDRPPKKFEMITLINVFRFTIFIKKIAFIFYSMEEKMFRILVHRC